MQKHFSMSEMHSEYIQGKINRKVLEGLIFQYLIDNFDRYRFFKGEREKWTDFVSWLYPRLSRAIDYYKETGASFDAYINAIIQWSCKEYRIREAEHYATEFACWKARAEEMTVYSNEAEYNYTDDWKDEEKIHLQFTDIKPRHIIILFLKSYYFINEEMLGNVSLSTGVKKRRLYEMIDKLRTLRSKREEKIHLLKERIHSQYYRCLAFEKRLSSTYAGTAKHEKLKSCLERAHQRYGAILKRLDGTRKDATNQQVAEILNIPRGTVDSALHSIRGKLKESQISSKNNDIISDKL